MTGSLVSLTGSAVLLVKRVFSFTSVHRWQWEEMSSILKQKERLRIKSTTGIYVAVIFVKDVIVFPRSEVTDMH